MKICILTTGHPALDNRIFYKQALSLKKKYDDITLIVPDERTEYIEQGIRIIGVPRAGSLYGRFKLGDTVVAKAIELQPDICHFHDFELIYKVLKIKKALPACKLIYDVHEHYPDMMRMSRKIPRILRPLATFLVDKSELYYAEKFDQIITADDAVKDRFTGKNPRVDVVYNFTEFIPTEADASPKETELPEKEYDAIYQGDITLERGVYMTVQAIKLLKEKYPDIRMIFVGPFNDVEGKEIVTQYIEENDLSNHILFTGRVPHLEVQDYIRKSRVGVVTLLPLPKYFKNIPIKQFEYMSCGIPIVGSNLPPIQRFLTSYNSGIIVDPTKPEDIAKGLGILLADPRLCKEMGDNGIKAVREEYNWGKMEEKLLKIYSRFEN
ncbi:MAG: glycosyltransferase family 4 protein [Dehalobacter sp. 4CP]|uniref:glycosyltransferase family 4 protein n=1 Tax=Dehalobacter sp. CP TaxID=2594474 RepID=UPI0013CB3E55|nr:glycosyltransferase family 4 protein [Dehalobacter sp. 4CP]